MIALDFARVFCLNFLFLWVLTGIELRLVYGINIYQNPIIASLLMPHIASRALLYTICFVSLNHAIDTWQLSR